MIPWPNSGCKPTFRLLKEMISPQEEGLCNSTEMTVTYQTLPQRNQGPFSLFHHPRYRLNASVPTKFIHRHPIPQCDGIRR